MKKKLLIVLPDGIGLRNFGFSQFYNILNDKGIETIYWNSTPFDLDKIGLKSIALSDSVPFKTDLLKRVKIDLELDKFTKEFKDSTYQSYKFQTASKNIKGIIKNQIVNFYKMTYKNKIDNLQSAINKSVIDSVEFGDSLKVLQNQKPDLVFCTNQRASNALAPVLAAKSLNIPTACFIFSWDNLPKATKIIDTDYYLVWSDYMKKELQTYYPNIQDEKIKVTGTPQFESHFLVTKTQLNQFRKKYKLKEEKKYVLFSGDDITTSPKDEQYLEAICKAVASINERSEKIIEVLFRRCPVDFSDRYDETIRKYSNIVTEIKPQWERKGNVWNAILPSKEDSIVLANTIMVSDLVVNLGSSMVFDAVCHHKPTAYINFNPIGLDSNEWSVKKIYRFIHFQSMPKNAVIWLTSKDEIVDKILEGLTNSKPYVEKVHKWFSIINQHPPQQASKRIAEALKEIVYDKKNTF